MYLHTHLQALQLFPWHFEMARSAEEATWQLRRALRGGGGLAEVMQPPRPRPATTCAREAATPCMRGCTPHTCRSPAFSSTPYAYYGSTNYGYTNLLQVASFFDHALGISEPFRYGGVWAARDDGAPPEQWPQFVAAFQSACMRR